MRIDGITQQIAKLQTTEKVAAASIKDGSVISAQVLETTPDGAQLKLPGGAVIQARIEAGVALNAGDNVKLKMTDSASYPPVLQLLGHEASIKEKMAAMGVGATPQNIKIMQQLAQYGAPSRQALQAAISFMEIKGMDVNTAVFMAINGMQKEQAAPLMQLLMQNSGLAQGIATLLDALGLGQVLTDGQLDGQIDNPPAGPAAEAGVEGETAVLDGQMTASDEEAVDGEGASVQANANAPPGRESGAVPAAGHPLGEKLAGFSPGEQAQLEPFAGKIASFLRRETPPTPEQIDSFVKELPLSPGAQAEAAKVIRAVMQDVAQGNAAGLFAKLEGAVGDGLRMKQVGEELEQRLIALKETIVSTMKESPEKARVLGQVDNLIAQVKVAQDISKFAYVQVPVRFEDEARNAQLYVLKRDGKKRIDPENATLFLSLDTQHMGVVDSLIRVSGKDVTLQMRMDGEDKIGLFKEHTVELYGLLKQSGFKLSDVRYQERETPANPVNVEEVIQKEFMGRLKVDFKI